MNENVGSMTDSLTRAIHRAQLAKDVPQHEPKRAEPPPKSVELVTPSFKPQPSRMQVIQRTIATAYGLEVAELISPRRTQNFVRPRQLAMYLCSKLLPVSLPQIGRRFGDRDHTTVLHALNMVERRRREDLKFDFEVSKLMEDLREMLT